MRVLVTSGSGVIDEGLIPHLLEAGHHVRLLTRGADEAAREWPDAVEACPGDVTSPEQLAGVVDGCDAVVHITGIIAEAPPERTFARVNVGGTQNLLRASGTRRTAEIHLHLVACRRAGDVGLSRVQAGGGGVGPQVRGRMGDPPPRQRLWPLRRRHLRGPAPAPRAPRDAESVRAVDRTEASANPIPEFLAGAGARLADLAGMPPPFNDSQNRMLIEENVVRDPEGNSLTRVFNVTPTPLAEGLGVLADALMEMFRRRCTELMPIEFDGRFRPRRHDGRLAGDERRPGGGTEFDVAHRCATGGRRRQEARMRTWRQTRTC